MQERADAEAAQRAAAEARFQELSRQLESQHGHVASLQVRRGGRQVAPAGRRTLARWLPTPLPPPPRFLPIRCQLDLLIRHPNPPTHPTSPPITPAPQVRCPPRPIPQAQVESEAAQRADAEARFHAVQQQLDAERGQVATLQVGRCMQSHTASQPCCRLRTASRPFRSLAWGGPSRLGCF